jgi:hypothetical protein
MSKVYADKIEPRDSSMDVTIGTSTNTVTLAGNDLRANTVKDSGGNTLWTSDGSGNLSSINSGLAGNLVLLSTQTISSNTESISFTTGIDSTYDVYIFKYIQMSTTNHGVDFQFQGSTNGGTSYGVTLTTTFAAAEHSEADATAFDYLTAWDKAQGTSYQPIGWATGSDADMNVSGELYLFNPSSTTYVKHFYGTFNDYGYNDRSVNGWFGGYFNTTTAINALTFKWNGSGDRITGGTIKMYGLL